MTSLKKPDALGKTYLELDSGKVKLFFELFNIAEDVAKDIVMMYEIGQIQISIISIITCAAFLG